MPKDFTYYLQKISPSAKKDSSLNAYNTFKIGGNADYLLLAENTSQIIDAIKLANEYAIKVKLLGNGSNILVSDLGFRGLVIINKSNNWQIIGDADSLSSSAKTEARLASVGDKFYTTDGLDYSDPEDKRVIVRADSGVRVIPFIKMLLQKDITGLQDRKSVV